MNIYADIKCMLRITYKHLCIYQALAFEQEGIFKSSVFEFVKASRLGEVTSTKITFEDEHALICLVLTQFCHKFGWLPTCHGSVCHHEFSTIQIQP